jgi:hypothetical protein
MSNPSEPSDLLRGYGMQEPLPNATATLVLGILSLVGCVGYGIIGLILGVIALVLSNKDRALYRSNPGAYTGTSYSNSTAGRICAIIGLILSALVLLLLAVIIVFSFAYSEYFI